MNFSLEVILLSLLMFFGTFILGWMPTWLKASTKVMNLVSIFGAGMLVGAAIIVVIPEAVKVIIEATYDPKKAGEEEEVVPESLAFNMGTAIVVGFTIMLIIDESFKILQQNQALADSE
jgi:solute carrier family 39 (zinc transporter), member 9